MAAWKHVCVFIVRIRLHRGPVWCSDITVLTQMLKCDFVLCKLLALVASRNTTVISLPIFPPCFSCYMNCSEGEWSRSGQKSARGCQRSKSERNLFRMEVCSAFTWQKRPASGFRARFKRKMARVSWETLLSLLMATSGILASNLSVGLFVYAKQKRETGFLDINSNLLNVNVFPERRVQKRKRKSHWIRPGRAVWWWRNMI